LYLHSLSGYGVPVFRDDIGKIIAEARWSEGLSRREVAEFSNGKISEATISKIETGKVVPTPRSVFILCQTLGLDPHDYYKSEISA
jgi:transcriptional regulator with XRE-family HTH domain